jgi:hypothetical protein
MVTALGTTSLDLSPMPAPTKLEPRPSIGSAALTAMVICAPTPTSLGCQFKGAMPSHLNQPNGQIKTLMAMAITQQALHQMIALLFETHPALIDSDALTPMVMGIQTLIPNGQPLMEQMLVLMAEATQAKTGLVVMTKMVTVILTQVLIGPSKMEQMLTSMTRPDGLRK